MAEPSPAADEVRREVLQNGLKLILAPHPDLRSMAVGLLVRTGSRFEDPGDLGLSHFLEHMLFQGAEGFEDARALSRAVEDKGGKISAYTEAEHAAFWVTLHRRHALEGVSLLARMILNPRFEEEKVELERRVILQEMSQYGDARGRILSVEDLAYSLTWGEPLTDFHVLGREENLGRFTPADLERHRRKCFRGSNAVLCLSGGFPEEAALLAREKFAALPPGERPPAQPLGGAQDAPRAFFQGLRMPAATFKICHKAYPYRHPDFSPLILLHTILGGGDSSRLFARVRDELGLAYQIDSDVSAYSDAGTLDVVASSERRLVVATFEAVAEVLGELRRGRIEEAEVQRGREILLTSMDFMRDNPHDLADWYGRRDLLGDGAAPASLSEEMDRVRRIGREDVERVAREVLDPARRNLALVGPAGWFKRRRIRRALEGF